ncbi:MAG TPA: SRPBCC domain-containing protein [Gemmatimonadaceae bacterium]
MTTQKDFKRLVRGRMQKTGESYTSARARLLEKPRSPASAPRIATTAADAGPAQPPVAEFARIAGTADDTLKAKTGCTWEKWVWALDHVNAHAWPHKEIASYVQERYKVPGWWAQMVTVGYERIKGLRERGQRRGGSWEASKSATIPVAAGKLFRAFKEPRQRAKWLNGAAVVVRTSVPNKSVRLTWEDGSSVEAYFVSKGRSKTQVAIQHTKLENRRSVDRMKTYWTARLGELARVFGTGER